MARRLELDPMDTHTSLLLRYTEKAKTMSDAALVYSIFDVTKTLAVLNSKEADDPYIQKLMAEFDAYTVEQSKRQRARIKKSTARAK